MEERVLLAFGHIWTTSVHLYEKSRHVRGEKPDVGLSFREFSPLFLKSELQCVEFGILSGTSAYAQRSECRHMVCTAALWVLQVL
jgi:hypothetical protein